MKVSRVLLLVPVLLICAHGPTDCSQQLLNVTVVAGDLPSSRIVPQYSTSIVNSQYIVTFVSYYTTDARDGFISAALRPFHNWTILPRSNPSTHYPSDFSLLLLTSTEKEALQALTQHPAIKQITPQKKLTRMLRSGGGECMQVCLNGCKRVYVSRGRWLPGGARARPSVDYAVEFQVRNTPHIDALPQILLPLYCRAQLSRSSLDESVSTCVLLDFDD